MFYFCSTLNVNWVDEESATHVTHADGNIKISPAFDAHLRIEKNWSLKEPFARVFPSLATEANIR